MALNEVVHTFIVSPKWSGPDVCAAWQANALTQRFDLLAAAGDLEDALKVRLELKSGILPTTATPLAALEIDAPLGDSVDFVWSPGQMNQDLNGGKQRKFHEVLQAQLPATDALPERWVTLWTAQLTIHAHASSLTAPNPPAPSVALTEEDADEIFLRYDEEQSLTTPQKTQVRTNAGAASQSQVDQVSNLADTVASDLAAEIINRENADADTLSAAEDYADSAIAALVGGSPEQLNTLAELAQALDEDESFSATIMEAIGNNAQAIEDETAARELALENEADLRVAGDSALEEKFTLHQLDKILFPLIPDDLHATYGDHFTGGSLDAKWTSVNLSGGDFVHGERGGSWLKMAIGTASTGTPKIIHQPWTSATNAEITVRGSFASIGYSNVMWGPMFTDSSGNGVAAILYNTGSADSLLVASISAWGYATATQNVAVPQYSGYNFLTPGPGLWMRLRKAGTSYFMSISIDGLSWLPECPAGTYATAITRVGVGLVARFNNSAGNPAFLNVDYFNMT
jgi:hypothetical protein